MTHVYTTQRTVKQNTKQAERQEKSKPPIYAGHMGARRNFFSETKLLQLQLLFSSVFGV